MPPLPNPTHPRQVTPLLARAAQLLRAGRPSDAVVPLREAARLQPSNPIIQHDLGLAYLEIGRVPDAIAAFQRAVASNPTETATTPTDVRSRLLILTDSCGRDVRGPVALSIKSSPRRGRRLS